MKENKISISKTIILIVVAVLLVFAVYPAVWLILSALILINEMACRFVNEPVPAVCRSAAIFLLQPVTSLLYWLTEFNSVNQYKTQNEFSLNSAFLCSG